MHTFLPGDFYLPDVPSMEQWAVIACDQFTSQPEYWKEVREKVQDAPSALHLILPEAELSGDVDEKIKQINQSMTAYLDQAIFKEYPQAFIYVERTLQNGTIRQGVVGVVDLEQYDYASDSTSHIRATEKTVIERIPPRKKIRQDAPIELSHILLLCDDEQMQLIEPYAKMHDALPKLYEFDLMQGGGHIAGWLISGAAAEEFSKKLTAYEQHETEKNAAIGKAPMYYAVGDGNHSLASAKACYEALKEKYPDADLSNHPARFAMAELENIHADAQQFEPIHRVIADTDPQALLDAAKKEICAENGIPVEWYIGKEHGTILLDPAKGKLAVGILQKFLDAYLQEHKGNIDYIHGDDTLQELSEKDGSIGFLLPAMKKEELFPGIISDGVLPRKTFSMGHACEKRYYLEARKIVED